MKYEHSLIPCFTAVIEAQLEIQVIVVCLSASETPGLRQTGFNQALLVVKHKNTLKTCQHFDK